VVERDRCFQRGCASRLGAASTSTIDRTRAWEASCRPRLQISCRLRLPTVCKLGEAGSSEIIQLGLTLRVGRHWGRADRYPTSDQSICSLRNHSRASRKVIEALSVCVLANRFAAGGVDCDASFRSENRGRHLSGNRERTLVDKYPSPLSVLVHFACDWIRHPVGRRLPKSQSLTGPASQSGHLPFRRASSGEPSRLRVQWDLNSHAGSACSRGGPLRSALRELSRHADLREPDLYGSPHAAAADGLQLCAGPGSGSHEGPSRPSARCWPLPPAPSEHGCRRP